jgi:hypothetical protein
MVIFLLSIGEDSIRDALAIEAARSAGEESVETFSRDTQLLGGSMAVLIYGLLLGVVFGVVFAAVRHHSRAASDFSRALGLGAVAFGTLVLIPALKYPGNPPAVGDPETVDQRTAAYVTLLLASVVLAIGVWRFSRWLRMHGFEDHLRLPAAGLLYVCAVGVAYVLWPSNPDAIEVPAKLIWRFRLAAIGGAAALWAVLAVTFGWACLRAQTPRPVAAARRQ